MGGSADAQAAGPAAPQHRKGHRRQESMYAMTGLYSETTPSTEDAGGGEPEAGSAESPVPVQPPHATHVKCHSRNPSSGLVDREKDKPHPAFPTAIEVSESRDCGILGCRPTLIQRFASIKMFVLLLSFLVTLQQALSSGYNNSVITTIEKRFEIPSSLSGLIASSYEIGNVITVIFVSYLGSRRHIPVWIGVGALVMGLGSLVFMVPHFIAESNSGISSSNSSSDNICRGVSIREQDMGLGRLSSGLSSPPLAPHNNLRGDNCIQSSPSTFGPVLVFVVAQVLLGCGGSPLFTLGTTYIDDHVKPESASMYIGCMYSMAAFGPVLGFLLGAYLLSFHMDSFSDTVIEIDPDDHRWVGMWWGGFLLCGLLLILVAIPFFAFPKILTREKEKIRLCEKEALAAGCGPSVSKVPPAPAKPSDTGYGRDIKDIPVSMWRLVCNPVYVVTCLGACMELVIVSGFVVFLPKYLETQFSLGKSQASVFTGSVAIPGACIGIFMGGCLLKRLELRPKGAVQFVLISNTICLACYTLLFFLGCDNVKMAGTTIPYYNSTSRSEPFQVNLTAACNFGCSCRTNDVEPVCGNNGLTYFSPCHAGCTAFSSRSNYTNCACVHGNLSMLGGGPAGGPMHTAGGGSSAAASIAVREDFAEVTVVPVATAGLCSAPCTTIFPFLILLFFMTFIVAGTQMPLLMIVLRSVSEEERSFALGMQFVIFRLFGYIPAPILFGNLIDSTCIYWKNTCGGKGGRCLLYDIEQFRYKYVGLCGGIKILALGIFMVDWWLVRRRKSLDYCSPLDPQKDISGSIISLDKLFEEKPCAENMSGFTSGLTSGGSSNIGTPLDGQCTILQSESFRDQQAKPQGRLQRNDSQYSQDSQHSRTGMGKNSRVLVASKHLRNDSKTIQLETRHQLSLDEQEKSEMKHSRTDSRDLKHSRSNSKDYAAFPRSASKDSNTHSRSGSKDFKIHSRSNSRDISLDQIKHLALKSVENLDLASVVHSKFFDEEAKQLLENSNMVLRHRRTNSKDLKSADAGLKGHKRTSSQHIVVDEPETEVRELLDSKLPSPAAQLTFPIPSVNFNDKTLSPSCSEQKA